jgi:uncharacterized protein involved in response to NO
MRWRWATLLLAPHRLAFTGACAVLLLSALWWLWVQASRLGWLPAGPLAVSPSLGHGVVMVHGFMPLFFTGFLFTAGPKWLGVPGPDARAVLPAVALQALAWPLWLTGVHLSAGIAIAALLLAATGQALATLRFARLLRASPAEDTAHARVIAIGWAVGTLTLAGLAFALVQDDLDAARRWLHTALWGFVALVYVAVAHRMIPFFTSSALPLVQLWRPMWVLHALVATVALKGVGPWLTLAGLSASAWSAFEGFALLVAGFVVLWLAFMWGLAQSLKIRLLAMLHLGFVWLGLGLVIDGTGLVWGWVGAAPWSPLAALHATTMGFLGSLMVAMVTRVSCGHGGRSLVADRLAWSAFLLLQVATVLRIAAALAPPAWIGALTLAVAALWLAVVAPWALRLLRWYGQPRPDGRPG